MREWQHLLAQQKGSRAIDRSQTGIASIELRSGYRPTLRRDDAGHKIAEAALCGQNCLFLVVVAGTMAFDSKEQRRIMGRFATGVTVVTTAGNGRMTGLTANAVASLSLNPPLVLVAVDHRAGSYADLKENRCFAINILTTEQQEISQRFATPGPKDFSGLTISTAVTGSPIFADTLGYVDCKVVDVLAGGDHDIFVGEIVAGDARDAEPLLYFSGRYRSLAP